jgi:S-DNA-T family DNA segregation ATPase FtsK/SpoIIIE
MELVGKIVGYKTGPIVTLYEFIPSAGIKASKVIGLADDIARAMSSVSARISSQPGKNKFRNRNTKSKKTRCDVW